LEIANVIESPLRMKKGRASFGNDALGVSSGLD